MSDTNEIVAMKWNKIDLVSGPANGEEFSLRKSVMSQTETKDEEEEEETQTKSEGGSSDVSESQDKDTTGQDDDVQKSNGSDAGSDVDLDELMKTVEKQQEVIENQNERLRKYETKLEKRDYIEKAEDQYSGVHGSVEETAEMLRAIEKSDIGEEMTETILKNLQAMSEQLEQSDLFEKQGTDDPEGETKSLQKQVEDEAKELLKKSDEIETLTQAKARVWKRDDIKEKLRNQK